ncbi:MAG: REDY-like protein HapK [Sphingomonadaceae bacterium]|uniref:REDY-like protein HapK n=1 Tax=Thermaurantiacus sp. TaxID=2820283 RepID=UPI00298F1D6A|nr:REDY-like protein HapK [Thermaurantiacus sp.]MCS6987196.1 REDY-like protein HapK [Sphingomonadaceae bacterium]MDW8415770.1 REDY-like protein HapK [Thermaurantiacus sp.]
MRIIALFNLKPGVDPAEYEAWARTRDLPGVRALPSVEDFRVHRVTGRLGGGAAPYAYAETIDVRGLDPFLADVAGETVQRLAAEFGRFAQDPVFLLTEDL